MAAGALVALTREPYGERPADRLAAVVGAGGAVRPERLSAEPIPGRGVVTRLAGGALFVAGDLP